MRIVIAIGGNALLKRGEALEAAVQQKNIATAAAHLAPVLQQHDIILVHGNGPQVGLLALQAAQYTEVAPYPLDILIAETQGMIGYLLTQAIQNILPDKSMVTLLTRIAVDAADPAFQKPTKFIGPVYDKTTAEKLAQQYQWAIKPDGQYFRRVVASPQPQKILELETIQHLAARHQLVVCAGGGGVPVIASGKNTWRGVAAVIDKDFSAALVAEQLAADRLVILTDIAAVELDWGTPQARALYSVTAEELQRHHFASGSMGPKIAAVCQFVTRTGKSAAIGALEDAAAVIEGKAGTQVKG